MCPRRDRNENKKDRGDARRGESQRSYRGALERGPAQRPEPDQPGGLSAVEYHLRYEHEEGDEGNLVGAHEGAGGGGDGPQGTRETLRGATA